MPQNKLILTAGPSITKKEISYVTDAITNGWNENWNSYITRFEDKFASYINIDNAITTSSCTGALHLGLLALQIVRPKSMSASLNLRGPQCSRVLAKLLFCINE